MRALERSLSASLRLSRVRALRGSTNGTPILSRAASALRYSFREFQAMICNAHDSATRTDEKRRAKRNTRPVSGNGERHSAQPLSMIYNFARRNFEHRAARSRVAIERPAERGKMHAKLKRKQKILTRRGARSCRGNSSGRAPNERSQRAGRLSE